MEESGHEGLFQYCRDCKVKGPHGVVTCLLDCGITSLDELRSPRRVEMEDQDIKKYLQKDPHVKAEDLRKVMAGLEALRRPINADSPQIAADSEMQICSACRIGQDSAQDIQMSNRKLRADNKALAEDNLRLRQKEQERDRAEQEEMSKREEEQRRMLCEIDVQKRQLELLEDLQKERAEMLQQNHNLQQDLLNLQGELEKRTSREGVQLSKQLEEAIRENVALEQRHNDNVNTLKKLKEEIAEAREREQELREDRVRLEEELNSFKRNESATQMRCQQLQSLLIEKEAELHDLQHCLSQGQKGPQGDRKAKRREIEPALKQNREVTDRAEHIKVGCKVTLPSADHPQLKEMRSEWCRDMAKHCACTGQVIRVYKQCVEVQVKGEAFLWDLEVFPPTALRYCFEGCLLNEVLVDSEGLKCDVCSAGLPKGSSVRTCSVHPYSLCQCCHGNRHGVGG